MKEKAKEIAQLKHLGAGKHKKKRKKWMKRNIKINHFDKVKFRQKEKSAFGNSFGPLIYVTIFKVFARL